MTKNKLTRWLFYLALFLMMVPFLQSVLHLFGEKTLAGAYAEVKNPTFSTTTWFNSTFQEKKETYLRSSYGFRPSLLRLQYQLSYDLYAASRVRKILVGKEDYLFQTIYTNADKGLNYKGEAYIDSLVLKLKLVHKKLQEEGKKLLVVIAPAKSHYYKEFLPDNCIAPPDAKTNYKSFIHKFKQDKIPFMDMNSLFLAMKDTTSYPLFPKTGIHYSTYGAALVVDSMVNYWERVFAKDLPDFYWDGVEWTADLRDDDGDLEWTMNLMYKIPNQKMAYPLIKIKEKGKFKPRILTVGDSYFWRFYHWGGLQKIYKKSSFLYYNKTVFPGKTKRAKYNLTNEMKSLEAICIFTNPSELDDFSWGIIDDLYFHYYGISKKDILKTKEKIKKNQKWLARIAQKAKNHPLSLDSLLYLEAEFTLRSVGQKRRYEAKKAKNPAFMKKVNEAMATIKSDPKWFAGIKKRANESNLPVDSVLYLDAHYLVVKQQQRKGKGS